MTDDVDAEVELGVVVGIDGSVFGYTCINDISARDERLDGDQWLLGKSMPGFCPVGPWIVTADAFDPTDVRLTLCDRRWTHPGRPDVADCAIGSRTSSPSWAVTSTLRPGDLIATGTPSGSPTPPGPSRRAPPRRYGDRQHRGDRRPHHAHRLNRTEGPAAMPKPPTVFLGEMTSPEVEAFLREHQTVIVPTGSTEQHGPHGPLLTDALVPTEVARRVAPRVGAVVAPPINYGLSYPHVGFTGLVHIRIPTFMALVEDVCASLASIGFRRIVFLNGHYDNTYAIAYACANVAERLPAGTRAFPVNYWDGMTAEEAGEYFGPSAGLHANKAETSAVMAINADLVDLEHANAEMPPFPRSRRRLRSTPRSSSRRRVRSTARRTRARGATRASPQPTTASATSRS